MFNPYAVYVNCDGAMDYNSKNSRGIGFIITFPDSIQLDPISFSIGQYIGGNIERLELEALIQAMKKTINVFEEHKALLRNVKQIVFITDRFGLCESEKTSPNKIGYWRSNKWRNHENKPIKNHKLLDELDKTRKKLSDKTFARVNIEYRPRKKNKAADKLAKAGKGDGLKIEKLSKKSEKIGKRKFDGNEIKYALLHEKQEVHIHIFRKDPVQDEWEVWAEICNEPYLGKKLKIYADDKLAAKLQRRNEYMVKIKSVYNHHILIYRKIKNLKTNAI